MNNAKNKGVLLAAALLSLNAFGDVVEDAKNTKSEYFGTMQVDSYNPVSFSFETMISNQKIELMLSSSTPNSSFFKILFSGESFLKKTKEPCDPGRPLTCPSPEIEAVSFHKLAVFLDGCNISSEVVRLCGLGSGCTIPSPTTSPDSLGESVTMTEPILLNEVDFGELSSTSEECEKIASGFKDDRKFTIQFRELLNESAFVENAAGRVRYDLAVRNRAYLPSKRKLK